MRVESKSEKIADGAVHVIGVALGLLATAFLISMLWPGKDVIRQASVMIYAFCLMAMLTCSGLYNIFAKDNKSGVLRRLDHSAIFMLIAGTYTPLGLIVIGGWVGVTLICVIWAGALAGIAIKLLHLTQFERFTLPIYLGLGWAGIIAIQPIYSNLTTPGLLLLAAGGGLYSFGTIFYSAQNLPFHNAIWHCFVLAAAACHYALIMHDVVLPAAS